MVPLKPASHCGQIGTKHSSLARSDHTELGTSFERTNSGKAGLIGLHVYRDATNVQWPVLRHFFT